MSHVTNPASVLAHPPTPLFDDAEVWKIVQKITLEAFGKEGNLTIEEDCEIPGVKYLRVDVLCHGELDDVIARHDLWHSRIAMLPVNQIGMFRLIITEG